jgi:hypothetical protein
MGEPAVRKPIDPRESIGGNFILPAREKQARREPEGVTDQNPRVQSRRVEAGGREAFGEVCDGFRDRGHQFMAAMRAA